MKRIKPISGWSIARLDGNNQWTLTYAFTSTRAELRALYPWTVNAPNFRHVRVIKRALRGIK